MSSIDIRFHAAIQRYLAQDEKYERRAAIPWRDGTHTHRCTGPQ
ncbi:hypothetical protein [Paraburkholderia sp. HD33-4]|nr:hypothetical protein [Paraburkholderia sp. HD33-4]